MVESIGKRQNKERQQRLFVWIFEEWVELINSGLLVVTKKVMVGWGNVFIWSPFWGEGQRECWARHLQPQWSRLRGAC
jgi:hypothetical protein